MSRVIVVLLLMLSCFGCTITVKPISNMRTTTQHHGHVKPSHTRPSPVIVDHEWLAQYHKLESDHGDYRISDDTKVETMANGKHRVTPAMLRHFKDLSVSPVTTPSPTLTPQ